MLDSVTGFVFFAHGPSFQNGVGLDDFAAVRESGDGASQRIALIGDRRFRGRSDITSLLICAAPLTLAALASCFARSAVAVSHN